MTPLGESLSKISKDLSMLPGNGLSVSSIQSNYDKKTDIEKDVFMQEFESFWFEKSTLITLVESMLVSVKRMTTLAPDLAKGFDVQSRLDLNYEIHSQWKLIIADLFAMTELIKKSALSRTNWWVEYPELNFARKIRNAFYQHPEIEFAFFNMGVGVSWQSGFLPWPNLGPSTGGLPFYFEYHQKRTKYVDKKLEDYEEMRSLNRQLLINTERWKDLSEEDRSQIKGWGLPHINENTLAQELEQLFKEEIFPYLKNRYKKAGAKGVV